MIQRCGVCGFETSLDVCPRCNTILAKGRAICPRCGKIFSGWVAECDACGTAMGRVPTAPGTAEAVRSLAMVPGISEDRARDLVGKGFRDFSDVVRLALPDSAVRKGLHHAIARKVMLSSLGSTTGPRRGQAELRCPTCGTPWEEDAEHCSACGSAPEATLDMETLQDKLDEVTGEIVDLADDPDFREMPEDVREELLRAFGGLDEEALLREEYARQIEAWRMKGFDVRPLRRLLEEDVRGFQEKSVRLIRAQMMKKGERGRYRCPLCEALVPSDAEECTNCGARFA